MSVEGDALEVELRSQLGELAVRFDAKHLETCAREIAAGRLGPRSNHLPKLPRAAAREDVEWLAELPQARLDRLAAEGRALLESGKVAVAVLNGGMATRFGGVVKGTVEAVSGRSFLELKYAQARARGPLRFAVMNSFATHRATRTHLAERGLTAGTETFLQSVSLRLTTEGDLFRDTSGRISPYAPGHGDFPEALRESGTLDRLRSAGVEIVMLSNVDNLGADPDPRVVGFHRSHGRPLTVELAESRPGDSGGAPVWVEGRLQVVEGFRFPPGFDATALPFLNTNTFLFSIEALERTYPLQWFYVEKRVEDRVAVQMERLVGQLSAFVETAYLAAPRRGPDCRFFPVKSRADLEALRRNPDLQAHLPTPVAD
ncbi:MAG: UTP--glucose-1-phosphate uridylyltransferase [Myxococcota bacterium]